MSTTKHWVCLACGFIYEGDEPPDPCPICLAQKRAFYPRNTMPDAPPLKTVEESKVKPAPAPGGKHWVCITCGHIHEGDEPPDTCPICGVTKDNFYPRQYY
jgi:rubrerythrin